MKLRNYLAGKIIVIAETAFIIVSIFLMGIAFKADKQYMIALAILVFAAVLSSLWMDYYKRKSFYNEFLDTLDKLDQKYLVTDMELKADFAEGEIMLSALYEIDKSMKEHINNLEISVNEFKEYLEMWVHEIKIPISALSLMNYNNNVDLKKQKSQIDKVSYYMEQILFYARADAPEKDYLIKSCKLENVVNKVVVEQKELLMGKKISIKKKDLDVNVMTDAKWLEFMVGQIVSNSVKYSDIDKKPCISFYVLSDTEKNEIKLVIEDNGIGIPSQDMPRIFDKTFTGSNGRKGAVSTGMGLFICKKLCKKLGHTIAAESKEGQYTKLIIGFGDDSFYNMK